MQIDQDTFDDIVKAMVDKLDAQHKHVKTSTCGGALVPFHLGYATASSAMADALQEHGITIADEAASTAGA